MADLSNPRRLTLRQASSIGNLGATARWGAGRFCRPDVCPHRQGQLAANRQIVSPWMVPPPPTASLRWLDRGWLEAPAIRRLGRRQVVGSNWQRPLSYSTDQCAGISDTSFPPARARARAKPTPGAKIDRSGWPSYGPRKNCELERPISIGGPGPNSQEQGWIARADSINIE
jgi:hypothetical protein